MLFIQVNLTFVSSNRHYSCICAESLTIIHLLIVCACTHVSMCICVGLWESCVSEEFTNLRSPSIMKYWTQVIRFGCKHLYLLKYLTFSCGITFSFFHFQFVCACVCTGVYVWVHVCKLACKGQKLMLGIILDWSSILFIETRLLTQTLSLLICLIC